MRVEGTARTKLRAIKLSAKKEIDTLEADVLGALDEIIKEQDRTIESLRAEVAELKGGSDERNNLRRDIKAMLDWLFTTEYSIKKAATDIDPKSHPNGHPPTSIKMRLSAAGDVRRRCSMPRLSIVGLPVR